MDTPNQEWAYNPKDASNAWPEGQYEATIERVEQAISKKHDDPMLVITLRVYGGPGDPLALKEYITNPPAGSGRKGSLWKLRGYADAVGKIAEFNNGTLRPKSMVGCNVTVTLSASYDPQFGDQNNVQKVGVLERLSYTPTAAGPVAVKDSECPF